MIIDNVEYFKHLKVVANVMKNFIQFRYPDLKIQILFPGHKYVLPNTDSLQIVFQKKSHKDLSNLNFTSNDNLPTETVIKLTLERYSVNFVSYTDKKGMNIAHIIALSITACFATQQALYSFQKAEMKVSYIGDCTDISSVEGADNLSRIALDLNIEFLNKVEMVAEYYDEFPGIANFNINN